MTPITSGKCPKHIRIFGLPQRFCPACEVNIEQSSNAIRRTIHEQSLAIGREIHEVESWPSLDLDVMSWMPVCTPNEKRALRAAHTRQDVQTVRLKVPIVLFVPADGDTAEFPSAALYGIKCAKDEFTLI